jgi:hypothetical protein
MGFVFPGLLVQPFQNFIGVGVDVEIHLLVVVLQQILGIRAQLLVYFILRLAVILLAGNYVHDQVLQRPLLRGVLDIDCRSIACVKTLHRSGQQFQREGYVEDFYWLQLRKLSNLPFGDKQNV